MIKVKLKTLTISLDTLTQHFLLLKFLSKRLKKPTILQFATKNMSIDGFRSCRFHNLLHLNRDINKLHWLRELLTRHCIHPRPLILLVELFEPSQDFLQILLA